jgi:hypothetical protein
MAYDAVGGLTWWKSSYSCDSAACVEVAIDAPSTVAVRDSKNVAGPHLSLSTGAFKAFIEEVRAGRLDRPAG